MTGCSAGFALAECLRRSSSLRVVGFSLVLQVLEFRVVYPFTCGTPHPVFVAFGTHRDCTLVYSLTRSLSGRSILAYIQM